MIVRRLKSLQARLLALLSCLLAAVWLGAVVVTWFDARHELNDLLDGHLAQAAALLVLQQVDDDDIIGVEAAPALIEYAPKVLFQVFNQGLLVSRSENAGVKPISRTTIGFSTVRLDDGNEWRVFAAHASQRDMQVYVGEQTQSRQTILATILGSMLWPLMFALPLLALVGWWAVHEGLSPLRELSHLLSQRMPQTLTPVVLPDMPSEMQPMVRSLNALFQRIERMLASERRFTADSAHELRTPLAAIRIQAQVALAAAGNDAQREHALEATLSGCDRATRLVEQLLTLSRLEAAPASLPSAGARVDLSELTRRIAADHVAIALARQQTLELEANTAALVAGDETLIGVLVRNLIDNALRYSPDQAQVLISVTSESGQTVLSVQDSGAGMTVPEMARLGERFFRVLGNEQPGSGLGWSIVKRIAAVFDAQVQVNRSERLGGLAVAVRWPAL